MTKKYLIFGIVVVTLMFASCHDKQDIENDVADSSNLVTTEAISNPITPEYGLSDEQFTVDSELVQDYFVPDASLPNSLEEAGITVESIVNDLDGQPELIPGEPVLGGTFYYSDIIVLNSSMVFAKAEDGHIGCDMLWGYKVIKQKITWRLLAYDYNETGLVIAE